MRRGRAARGVCAREPLGVGVGGGWLNSFSAAGGLLMLDVSCGGWRGRLSPQVNVGVGVVTGEGLAFRAPRSTGPEAALAGCRGFGISGIVFFAGVQRPRERRGLTTFFPQDGDPQRKK